MKRPPNPFKICNFGRPKSAILEGSRGVPEVWGWSWGLLGSPGESRRAPGGLPGASRGAPGGLPGGSQVSRGVLGGSWAVPGGPWGLLWGVPGGPGGVPRGSRGVLGGSWKGSRGVWGRSWGPRTPRKLILDRFGADVGWNSAPGTTENCSFPLGFC